MEWGASKEYTRSAWHTMRLDPVPGWWEKVAGDLGGNFLPRDPTNLDHENLSRELNEQWLGVKLKHFKQVAAKARKRPGPGLGVVVIAHGKAKAAALRQAIELGCVTRIIVDDELAGELLHSL